MGEQESGYEKVTLTIRRDQKRALLQLRERSGLSASDILRQALDAVLAAGSLPLPDVRSVATAAPEPDDEDESETAVVA